MNNKEIKLLQDLVYNNNKFKELNDNNKTLVNNYLLNEINSVNNRFKDLLKENNSSIGLYKVILQKTFNYLKSFNISSNIDNYKNEKLNEINRKFQEKQLEFNNTKLEKPKEIDFNINNDDKYNDNINDLYELKKNSRNEINYNFNELDKHNAKEWLNGQNIVNKSNHKLKINEDIDNKKVHFDEIVETINEKSDNELLKLFKNINDDMKHDEELDKNNEYNNKIIIEDINLINKKISNIEKNILEILTNQEKIIEMVNNNVK